MLVLRGGIIAVINLLLFFALDVGVHADAPAHSFPTNADARGEAVRTEEEKEIYYSD